MRKISVADYFVEFIISHNVKHVFGYQGGMIAYIIDSLGKYSDKITYHSCGSEQGAAFAACAYAQSTGNFGVAISTSGPGFTNLLTGIANAYYDSIPVLFISGNVNTKDLKKNLPIRQLGFQETNTIDIVKPLVKKAYQFDLETDYINTLFDAYKTMMNNRKGPVFIDLPINVCREFVSINSNQVSNDYKQEKSDAVNSLFSELKTNFQVSKKPLIIAGAGIKQSGCVDRFRKILSDFNIPVVTTLPAVDVLPTESELNLGFIGATGNRTAGLILQKSDFVICLGTRLCSKQLGHNLKLFAPNAKKVIRIDIDKNEFIRKVSENEIDFNVSIEDFLNLLEGIKKLFSFSDWVEKCSKIKQILSDFDKTLVNDFLEKLTDEFPNNSNLLFDVGKNLTYCCQSSKVKKQTKIYGSFGLGSMGYSLPASIGAYYGNHSPTFCFMGDGGAQMNIQELNTIAKNNLPISIFVFNNHSLGNIRIFQKKFLDSRYVGTMEENNDYFSCNFSKIAEAYGINSFVIDDLSNIEKIRELLNNKKPVLFEINYEDCDLYPDIAAGGNYLNENNEKIPEGILKQVKNLLELL